MPQNDDTQPRSPFQQPTAGSAPPFEGEPLTPTLDAPPDAAPPDGPGCAMWGLAGVVIAVFALAIVGLAGAAGWTTGERIWQVDATATQDRRIAEQLARIPTDIAAGNPALLGMRLNFLAELTPGVPGVDGFAVTATALALPTVTPTPTPTLAAPTGAPAASPTPEAFAATAEPGAAGPAFDLDALYAEAQRQVSLGQYEEAIETLDVLIALDETYQTAAVRALMTQALTTHAANLFTSLDTIAEAIFYTDRAEEFGADIGELSYERLVGQLYLDATRVSDLGDYGAAIRAWQRLLNYQPEYKGVNVRQQIFRQYVLFGDAWVAGGQPCLAVPQYINALSLFNSPEVTGKRDAAQQACANATPTPDPNNPGGVPGEQPTVAPIGVPGT